MRNDVIFSVNAIELFERPVRLRLPFRFGGATLNEAPQAFARARIRFPDGRDQLGWAAEMMIPKWFDKSPQRSNADNLDDLRRSLALAAEAYAADRTPRTAFDHSAIHYASLQQEGARHGLNALVTSYGAALIDRAILDALCQALAIDFASAIRANVPRIDATLTPDLRDFAFDAFLDALDPAPMIDARHTVGLLDPLSSSEVIDAPDDDLPVALDQVFATYGNRYFKIKLSGAVAQDVDRLVRIAAVLDPLAHYSVTLDGNEQFAGVDALADFWAKVDAEPRLARLSAATLYLEQPLPREHAFSDDIEPITRWKPLVIDESDATFDAFPRARECGYAGVSSKSCKGVYKSLVNAARCAYDRHSKRSFMTGEDLTAQAGLALQQDLALVGLIGLTHVERNGHHYVDGFGGQGAGAREQQAFVNAHPDLYQVMPERVRLTIRGGKIALRSLRSPGFASAAVPDIESMTPMRIASPAFV
jgi:hypothetical protein